MSNAVPPLIVSPSSSQTRIPKLTYRNSSYGSSNEDRPPLPSPSSQPRVPKLTFRNVSYETPDDGRSSISIHSMGATGQAASTAPSSPASPSFPSTVLSPTTSSSTTSTLQSQGPTPDPMGKHCRKKGSSLFGFLSVKDPSTEAFLNYQKAVATTRATNGAVVRPLPGVSSARLPTTVPKVNSRWDGMPKVLKEKEEKARGLHRQSSLKTSSRPSSQVFPFDFGHADSVQAQKSTSTVDSKASSSYGIARISTSSSHSNLPWGEPGLKLGSKPTSLSDASAVRDFARPSTPQSPFAYSTTSLPETIPQEYQADRSTTTLSASSVTTPADSPSMEMPSYVAEMPRYKPTNTVSRQSLVHRGPEPAKTPPVPPLPDKVIAKALEFGVLGPPASAKQKPSVQALQLGNAAPRNSPGFLAGEAEPLRTPPDDPGDDAQHDIDQLTRISDSSYFPHEVVHDRSMPPPKSLKRQTSRITRPLQPRQTQAKPQGLPQSVGSVFTRSAEFAGSEEKAVGSRGGMNLLRRTKEAFFRR
ncbi:MAG: hypothetical protein M1833_001584 [Piccolia ochrophora]|nr:MAG: hypothetical protein M1833_001584 [Piccolia ochrophora]